MNILSKKEILCTLGPSSMNDWVIKRLESLGVSLFRVNLSHTKIDDLPKVIRKIQRCTSVPICLDTEGAQIRTGNLLDGKVMVKENNTIRISKILVDGDENVFNLNPVDIIDKLEVGDLISIDFNSVLVHVIERDAEVLTVRVITGGLLGQNKAVSVDRRISVPALTKKDYQAINIGKEMNIRHVALSFANFGKDVDEIRSVAGEGTFVISKIESYVGVNNIEEIANKSDALVLDRGDLSREVPIEQIPRFQKEIISRAKKFNKELKVYVATNLLESMITALTPTRAEVNDIFNTLIDGADGLVLAAETAIGTYPVQCATMVSKIIQQFMEYSSSSSSVMAFPLKDNSCLLAEPHGGILVNRINTNPDFNKIKAYKEFRVDISVLLDAEQIAIGSFSPLEGFMTKNELESVVENCRLPNGLVWTLPIVLQVQKDKVGEFKIGDDLALSFDKDGEIYSTFHIDDIYSYDLSEIANKVFGCDDYKHPGVNLLMKKGEYFLGGKVELIKRLSSKNKYIEMTPKQTRIVFKNKGWNRVVGFHTRNVPHRAHETIQLLALERYHCDGLFIHPLTGYKKEGDYSDYIIRKSYELMLNNLYSEKNVFFTLFQNYPRYAGPREAVFTALCRKNFGCSHFIVGRDHSGVYNYYEKDSAHKLFSSLGDIGIQPIFFNEIHYCSKCLRYTDKCIHNKQDILEISGSHGREMLKEKKALPAWFMREDISEFIICEINNGKKVFL